MVSAAVVVILSATSILSAEWHRKWKGLTFDSMIVFGLVDVVFGLSKRAKKYRKAASILTVAIDRYESAQAADLGALEIAAREATAALG